jgi:hypothetical protein
MSMADRDVCDDCGVNVFAISEYGYMLTLPMWTAIGGGRLLCIGCVETRLGRRLGPDDFSNALCNEGFFDTSERLTERLRGKVFLDERERPQARAIEAYLDSLGVTYTMEMVRHPHFETIAEITLGRGERSITLNVQQGAPTRARAIEHLFNVIRTAPQATDETCSVGLKRSIRRYLGRAEVALRTIFSASEREELTRLFEVSPIE